MRHFTLFLFLMLLPVLPASAADFLAADRTAALYRTGTPDPVKEEHQFLNPPVTEEEFYSFPLVAVYNYIEFGINFITDLSKVIIKEKIPDERGTYHRIIDTLPVSGGVFRVEFTSLPDVSFAARITDGSGTFYDAHSVCYQKDGKRICEFTAPDNGDYTAYISGKKTGDKYYTKLWVFTLRGTAGTGPNVPAPHTLALSDKAVKYGITILSENLSTPGLSEYTMELRYPAGTSVYSGIWNREDKRLDIGTVREVLTKDESGTTVLYTYRPEYPGEYTVKVRVKPSGASYYSDTAGVVRISVE